MGARNNFIKFKICRKKLIVHLVELVKPIPRKTEFFRILGFCDVRDLEAKFDHDRGPLVHASFTE